MTPTRATGRPLHFLEILGVAYHEAAHAVVALHLRRGVLWVSVPTHSGTNGGCRLARRRIDPASLPEPRRRRAIETEILILYAGQLAQSRLMGRGVRRLPARLGCGLDNTAVLDLAWKATGDVPEARALARGLMKRAAGLVGSEPIWCRIVALAEQLARVGRLSGREVRQLVEGPATAKKK